MNKDQIIEAIESMTVLELSKLVKALEEKSGVQKTYEEKTVEDFLDSL